MKRLFFLFMALLLGSSLAWGSITVSGTITVKADASALNGAHLLVGNEYDFSSNQELDLSESTYSVTLNTGTVCFALSSATEPDYLFSTYGQLIQNLVISDGSGDGANPLKVSATGDMTVNLVITSAGGGGGGITVSGSITVNGSTSALSGTKLMVGTPGDPSSLQELNWSSGSYSVTMKAGTVRFALGSTLEADFLFDSYSGLSKDWSFSEGSGSVNPLSVEANGDLTKDLVIVPGGGSGGGGGTKVNLVGSITQCCPLGGNPGVEVSIAGNGFSANTTSIVFDYVEALGKGFNGYYKFSNVPEGDYTLTYSKEGYKTKTTSFTVDASQANSGYVEIPAVSLEAAAAEYTFKGINLSYVQVWTEESAYVSNATVSAYSDYELTQKLGETTTDAQGNWELTVTCEANAYVYFDVNSPKVITTNKGSAQASASEVVVSNITCIEKQPPMPSNPMSNYSLTQEGTKSHMRVKLNWAWSQELQNNYRQSATEGIYSIRRIKIERKVDNELWKEASNEIYYDYYTLPSPSFIDDGTANNSNGKFYSGNVVTYRISEIQYKYPDSTQVINTITPSITLNADNADPDTAVVTLSVNDPTMGTVAGGGKFVYGRDVEITATPNTGYRFVEWKIKNKGTVTENPYTILNIQDDFECEAIFAQEVTLTIVYDASMGEVKGATSGTYAKGTSFTVIATPKDGCEFVAWKEGETEKSTEPEYTFTLNENITLTAEFNRTTPVVEKFNVEVSTPNAAMGSVSQSGNGTYDEGTSVTVTAIPAQYHSFVEWQENGAQVSKDAEYTFTIEANRSLTAIFKRDSATLTLKTNNTANTDMGTVSGGGKYPKGTNVTAKATTKPYHQFVGWKNAAGTQISTEKSFTFFFTQDSTLTAVFECDSVNLTLQPKDPAMGSVSGAGRYHAGNNATATATPAENHSFVEWQENGSRVSGANPYTFAITKNRSLTAVFKPDTVTLTLRRNDADMGTVSGGRKYQKGQTATITAAPAENHVFVEWRENDAFLSKDNPYQIEMNANRTVTAVFQPDSVNLELIAKEAWMGKVTGAGKHQKGQSVDIFAEPNDGYVFVEWRNGDNVFSKEPEEIIEQLTQDMSLTALFKPDSVQLNLSVKDPKMGTVTGEGRYRRGQSARIQAIANTGYRWKEWRENDTVVTRAKTNPHSFNIQRDRNLVAVFEPDSVYLTLQPNNPDWGSVTGGGRYRRNTTARVKATANPNYVFEKWVEADTTVIAPSTGMPATAEFTTRQLNANRTFTAIFKRDSAVLTLRMNNSSMGTVTGGGKYAKGQNVTVTATANDGYEFVDWRDAEGSVSTESTYTFAFTGALTLTAYFKAPDVVPDSATLTLTVNDAQMGTAAARGMVGGAKFEAGEHVRITATPNTGYKFVEWRENDVQLSTANPYEVEIEANTDRTIQAVFALKPDSVYLTLQVNDENMGIVEGEGKYEKGQQVSAHAIPTDDDLDYVFVAWKDNDGQVVSTDNPYKFNIESDLTLTAWFQPDSVELELDVNETRMGTVQGAGRYPKGSHVGITATPNTGYVFVEWKKDGERFDNGSDNESTMTVDLDESLHLTAFFKPDSVQLNLSVKDPAMGSVKGAGTYKRATSVTIEAIANEGYKFSAWTENDTVVRRAVNARHTFTIQRDRNLVAVFVPDSVELTLEANNPDWGTVSGGGKFVKGKQITIHAVPNTGYVFEEWQEEDGGHFASDAEHTYTITKTRKLIAVFAKAPVVVKDSFDLYLHVDEEQGMVEGAGRYEENTEVTIKAIAKTGYKFQAWTTGEASEIVATTAEHKVLMTRDSVLTAVFEAVEPPVVIKDSFEVKLAVNNADWGTVTGEGKFEKGTTVSVKATANEGYEFKAWNENGSQVSTNAEYSFTIDANRELTAMFEAKEPPVVVKDSFEVKLAVNDASMGTVTGEGKFEKGSQVTVKATANEGYEFKAWNENGSQVSTDAEYSFTITANRNLTAMFEAKEPPVVVKDSFEVKLAVNDAKMGTVTGEGKFEKGTRVTVKATANAGYEFQAWKEGETEVSKDAEYSFTITANRNLTAVFVEKTSNEEREQAAWSVTVENQTLVLHSEAACQYDVYNMAGTLVEHAKTHANQYRVAVNNSGLYIIRRISATGYSVKKVVVR